jgi:Tol biopolymer transport system component
LKRLCAVVVVAGLALLSGVVALSGSNPAGAGQFPGTNGKIAYEKYDATFDSSNIWVINPDGTGDTQLTFGAEFYNYDPAWSPDGTRIAFASGQSGGTEVWVMNADGSGQTRLTNVDDRDDSPSWSPDGTRIAFDSFRDDNYEVYVMGADGSGQTNITNNPPDSDFGPEWSPDGTRIAFTSGRDGNFEVYVMNADGTDQTGVTTPASGENPSWQSAPVVPPTTTTTTVAPPTTAPPAVVVAVTATPTFTG